MIKKILKNKKGDITLVEAFVAISLIIIIVLIIIQENPFVETSISKEIYSVERGILKNIQFNETLRGEILSSNLPNYWSDFSFPIKIKEEIEKKKTPYLECRAKICEMNQICQIEEIVERDIYTQSAFISANSTVYSPRVLKLFCWEK